VQSVVDVEIGTPPVTHTLLFDSGSSTTWMVAAECDGTALCPNSSGFNRTGYNQTASSTSNATGTYGSIDYLGGTTAGAGMEDVFTFPSAPDTVWRQTFLEAYQSSWSNIPADGFLGLAFSTISEANTTTLVETLLRAGKLDEPRFGLYYGTELENTGESAGEGRLTLGGSHEDKYVEGDLVWTNLQLPDERAQLWRVSMLSAVGTAPNKTQSTLNLSGAWGVFDTGAGRISVPDRLIDDIYASIGMNWTAIIGGEHLPLCTEFTDAWSIELNMGDGPNPSTVVLTGDMLKKPGFATGEAKYCWPPFDPSGSDGLFLFGGDFLQMHYTVFDFGGFEPSTYKARIGVGALKDEYRPEHI
jgi:saccharopepsin